MIRGPWLDVGGRLAVSFSHRAVRLTVRNERWNQGGQGEPCPYVSPRSMRERPGLAQREALRFTHREITSVTPEALGCAVRQPVVFCGICTSQRRKASGAATHRSMRRGRSSRHREGARPCAPATNSRERKAQERSESGATVSLWNSAVLFPRPDRRRNPPGTWWHRLRRGEAALRCRPGLRRGL